MRQFFDIRAQHLKKFKSSNGGALARTSISLEILGGYLRAFYGNTGIQSYTVNTRKISLQRSLSHPNLNAVRHLIRQALLWEMEKI